MTTIRRFCCNDLLRFAPINLGKPGAPGLKFYMSYMGKEPHCFLVANAPGNRIMGYLMGRTDSSKEKGSTENDEIYHGLITLLPCNSEYRSLQLAKNLTNLVEAVFELTWNVYFVEISLNASNSLALKIFGELGYVIYRRIPRHYFDEEDAIILRKPLSRDEAKKSIKTSYAADELYTVDEAGNFCF